MDIKRINDDVSVAPQIAPGDVAAIKAAGFRAIVCNRPDGESSDQPDCAAIEAAAREAGLAFRNVPVVSGMVTEENARDFRAALDDLPAPVLAYCRSGTRSAILCDLAGVAPSGA